ncbi:MAG TPA: hypothetical protein VKM94_05135 [Blastocatellia bacterium]|nr:hypothetical protein [Blastocatellia bacterium]
MKPETEQSLFEAFLNSHDDVAWSRVLDKLSAAIHPVDRTAVRIWFYFYPLGLLRLLRISNDEAETARKLQLQGTYYLKDQIDSSHWFLYGHRYWKQVKAAVCDRARSDAAPSSLDLAAQISEIAKQLATTLRVEPSLLTAIVAIGLMTLQQTRLEAFKASPGKPGRIISKSPERLLKARSQNDSQGPLGFLRGDAKRFSVRFDERDPKDKFALINTQHLTTAAAQDKREFHQRDSRCVVGEGPIPVECRSASCGTCWVGILGGCDNLSPVQHLESRRIKEFGYIDTDESRPLIRLACQAQATGNVTIVIPPWNGVYGKHLKQDGAELEEERTGSIP